MSNNTLEANYEFMKKSPVYLELKTKYKELKRRNQQLVEMMLDMRGLLEDSVKSRLANKNVTTPVYIKQERVIPETIDLVDIEEGVALLRVDTSIADIHPETCLVQEEKIAVKEQVEDIEVEVEEPVEESVEEEEEVIEQQEEQEEEPEQEEQQVEDIEAEEEEEQVEEEDVEQEVEESVEEQEEEVEEVEESVEEQEEVEEVEEEEGVYEIEISGQRYYTTNEQSGQVYALLEDDEIGDLVGKFENGLFIRE
jgi:hypothetical protein